MPQMEYSIVLRVFGPERTRITELMQQAAKAGCPGLNLLMRGGEYAVCVTARGETEQAARIECARWREYFMSQLGPAVFSENETTHEQITLHALAKKEKLFVAADRETGRLLNNQLELMSEAHAVYDFGEQSYAAPKADSVIRPDRRLERKYPGLPVQKSVGKAQAARRMAEADWSVTYSPASGNDPDYVLVCGKKQVYLRALPAGEAMDELALGWIMEILRRLALGLEQEPEVKCFDYGKDAPALLAAVSEQPRPAAVTQQEADASASQLYDDELTDEELKPVRRTRWGRVVVCVLLVAAIAAGAFLVHGRLGEETGPEQPELRRGYGTADYDSSASQLLADAQKNSQNVVGYLTLPNLPGAFVYTGADEPQPSAVVHAAEDNKVRLGSRVRPGQPQTNLLLDCPAAAMQGLDTLDQLEKLADNSGFTIYTNEGAFRYKTTAVFYWEPSETGDTALDLENLQDLSNYQDYLTFVLGTRARSLFDMPADVKDGDSFATLVTDAAGKPGQKLVITGRLLRSNEAAILFGRQIETADEPLMPISAYTEGAAPEIHTLEQYWLNWYMTGGAQASEIQEDAGMPEEDVQLEDIPEPVKPEETAAPAESAEPSATPDPSASPKPSATPGPSQSPEPSEKPEKTPAPNKPTQAPTAAPTAEPTPAPTPAPTEEPAPEPTPTPKPAQTISVTMNGVWQEMDLVECLAMIARNEMGPNAPTEAYKAQIVAAHSWILNQGGAPSVSGREPNEKIRQAAREVANQVLTYNGGVAFTPYYASAAFGTNSSEDVWGGARPYLVSVESPYDKDYASNWQNTRTYYKDEVLSRAQERLGIDLAAYSENPEDWMGDLVKNNGGYVVSMRIGDQTITGRQLREKVLNNVNGKTLRSAAFDIVYDAGAEAFQITTYGYGHGCGMSQMGAVGYASNGWGYADILAHYYPGTTLVTQ